MRILRPLLAAALVVPTVLLAVPASAATCASSDPADPCLTLTPAAGPVGTHVRISGRITHDLAMWRDEFHDPAYFALITDIAGCELLVGADNGTATIARDGTVTGSFTVGSTGSCFQSDGSDRPTAPGRYWLSIGCHACGVAQFTVTAGSLPFTGAPSPFVPVAAALIAITAGVVLSGRVGRVRGDARAAKRRFT